MGNGSAGYPVLKAGTVITPGQLQHPAEPSALPQQGSERRRILREQALPQQSGESSGDLLWSSRTH